MYFHVILFAFAEGVSASQADDALRELGGLRARIPQIRAYHFGRNDADNPHNGCFSHCFVMAFDSRADRYAYQNHPLHLAFIRTRLEPMLADSAVLDFPDMDDTQ
ncbi:Dabb family protein [Burkholderia vietnamiensis]|uniref:Dabb family protein n=1 Tax=Burkholderia vietnamiensis TaxID=60552 RepID=UPI000754D3DF|nr:Dabb family protein [Burkholderia vietnamiensis]KVE20152.1 hypothetical protein WI92_28395 [Burkholderia vietnamiensis]KVF05469.1 hypothetical protein WJ05_28770 [Burkholderia vietnamiensis]CAG9222957.1 Stress responsive A/B Barrel Domain [Burkholderia vietnamiensis]